MRWQAEAFWDYSLSVYQAPGVASRLLHLQDAYGLNVNDVLLVLFAAQQGRMFTQEQWQDAIAATAQSRQQTDNLRTLRRAAKGSGDYASLKALELDSEYQQQRTLLAAFYDQPSYPLSDPATAVWVYAKAMVDTVSIALTQDIEHLVVSVPGAEVG